MGSQIAFHGGLRYILVQVLNIFPLLFQFCRAVLNFRLILYTLVLVFYGGFVCMGAFEEGKWENFPISKKKKGWKVGKYGKCELIK